jgi:Mrp family chromosome partitioning ATPase
MSCRKNTFLNAMKYPALSSFGETTMLNKMQHDEVRFDLEFDRTAQDQAESFLRHDPELIKLFYTVEATRPKGTTFVLQFLSTLPGEGTTTIARGFAAVAANHSQKRVLLINCGDPPEGHSPHVGGTLLDSYRKGEPMQKAVSKSGECKDFSLVRLSNSRHPLMETDGAELTRLLNKLQEEFSVIIFDCPAATRNPDSVALSRYCDGTILVVRAEYTPIAAIASVQNDLRLVGGEVVGVVFNRRQTYIPNWLYRRLFANGSSNKREMKA